jgi:TonB-linked SusC/RagA family outer membrane protein
MSRVYLTKKEHATLQCPLKRRLNGHLSVASIAVLKLFMCIAAINCVGISFAQDNSKYKTVTGTIVGNTGEPLNGVTVFVKGTTNGTSSDSDGKFRIDAPDNSTLVFMYVGFGNREIKPGKRTVLDVVMIERRNELDEVVIIGYGEQKKVNLSGAVQVISSKSLLDRPVTNVNQALQGLASNVNISMLDGRANSVSDVNIRGFTSINGGSALILVDNVPVGASELSTVNPADIESAVVLKDAASAAIYGGRAAFGVILITTKKASDNRLRIDADVHYGVRVPGIMPNIVTDVYEVMKLQNPASTRTPLFSAEEMEYGKLRSSDPDNHPAIVVNDRQGLYSVGDWAYWDNTDWQKVVFRKSSSSYTANLRIAQKTDRMNYALSGGYYRQNGMLNHGNDIFHRYNLRGNGGYTLTEWLRTGFGFSFAATEYDTPEVMDELYFRDIYRSPLRSIKNPDGTWTQAGASIVGLADEGGRRIQNTYETQMSLNTVIDIFKDVWTIKADANVRVSNGLNEVAHYPIYARLGPSREPTPYYSNIGEGLSQSVFAYTASSLNTHIIYNVYTDFNKTFAGKHFVHAIAGFNQESMHAKHTWIRKKDLISTSFSTIQLATGATESGQSISELALRGVFGRLNYIFDDKYIIEFNGRYDGTSRYPKSQRFGFFPSGSAAWVLSNESFLSTVTDLLRISNLKIRGSYGILGNQATGSYYPYIATMGAGNIPVPVNGEMRYAIYQPGVVSNSLTWEKVRTLDGGIDLGLFDNRINLSFDRYKRFTEGMLTQSKALPGVFGAAPPSTNAADLVTKGWELTLELNNDFNLAGSPLQLGFSFMISDNKTVIRKYDNPTKQIYRSGSESYYEGAEIGTLWGFVTDGFLQKSDLVGDGTSGKAIIDQYEVAEDDNARMVYEGDIKFKDLNGDGSITFGKETLADPGDRRVIGNSQIHFPYSFTLNAAWKGFDLRAFFQGVGKRDWYPGHNEHYFWGIYGNPWASPIKENYDHWTPENPNAYYPRLKPYIAESDLELGLIQTKYLQDASYLRLKNLTFGYTLPASMTDRWGIAKLRVYFSAENILTFSHLKVKGVDPEGLTTSSVLWRGASEDGKYPFQRVFSFGLNLSF